MAKDETVKLPPKILEEDERTLMALLALPGYAPANPEINIEGLSSIQTDVEMATKHDIRNTHTQEMSRRDLIRIEWARHNRILAARNYVRGHFGDDSKEMEWIGMVPKSARRLPGRRNPPKNGDQAAE